MENFNLLHSSMCLQSRALNECLVTVWTGERPTDTGGDRAKDVNKVVRLRGRVQGEQAGSAHRVLEWM